MDRICQKGMVIINVFHKWVLLKAPRNAKQNINFSHTKNYTFTNTYMYNMFTRVSDLLVDVLL